MKKLNIDNLQSAMNCDIVAQVRRAIRVSRLDSHPDVQANVHEVTEPMSPNDGHEWTMKLRLLVAGRRRPVLQRRRGKARRQVPVLRFERLSRTGDRHQGW